MTLFDFTVASLQTGRASVVAHNAQFIAEQIVEQFFRAGATVTPGIRHYAIDQTAVDISE
jgi:hypothetical protein